ncbi:MAG: GIY-YIG nuclease family protein [Candidatus Hadarchaeota archaeon]|nr:GIY-YIG nuclease family protein [Candidatus Hadarchaeota archaeon]
MSGWHVYVVRCAHGALYTGIAIDVEARIKLHNSGKGAKAVRALGLPVKLVYQEEIGSYSEALKREAQVKRLSKAKKESLIGQAIQIRGEKQCKQTTQTL